MAGSPFTGAHTSPFTSGISRKSVHGDPRSPLVRLGTWLFAGTIAVCGATLVMDHYSNVWPGPEMRLGFYPRLAPLPVLMLAAAVACFARATRGRTFKRPMGRLLPLPVLCLLALAVWEVAGSLYSRVYDNNPYTFFAEGVAVLAAPLAYWCCELTPDPVGLMRAWVVALAVGAGPVLLSQLSRFLFTTDGGYTEHFPVVFACGAWAWFTWPGPRARIAAGLLIAVVCVLSLKKSGIMCAGAMAIPLVVDHLVRRFGATRKTAGILLAMVVAVGVGVALLLLFLSQTAALRTGEHAFREWSFEFAWNQFAASPFIGQSFTGLSAIANPYLPGEWKPVHNDVLDVLRQGGLVGFALFAGGLYSPWWTLWRRRRRWRAAPPGLLAGAATLFGTTVVILFNPTLLTADIAIIVMATAGVAIWHQVAFRDAIRNQETTAWLQR